MLKSAEKTDKPSVIRQVKSAPVESSDNLYKEKYYTLLEKNNTLLEENRDLRIEIENLKKIIAAQKTVVPEINR